MKLILTLALSILAYFGMVYYGVSSLVIWIFLIILWTVIDYFTYDKPFSWIDYIILVIVLSLVEIGSWYNYFGVL
ncbi:hypothetical protein ABMY20_09835 [Tenacibaculum sp. SSH1-16]|uniref:hypothetical protein n=1 Tax=Tenacibaculum TaxID=104267 RepID=UPI00064ADD70|nr:hypothetical protein [Tenacibaculum mesophilum]BFF37831.1 hypothetical protein BACT7_26930 [Tenacibaculum mesophilum]